MSGGKAANIWSTCQGEEAAQSRVWGWGWEEGWGDVGMEGRGWEGAHTSSWENLSPCVISISLILQRECGELQGELGGAACPPPQTPLHSLGRFQPFPLWIKHLERVQNRLLRVGTCG